MLEVEEMVLSVVAVLALCETFTLIHGAALSDNGMEIMIGVQFTVIAIHIVWA